MKGSGYLGERASDVGDDCGVDLAGRSDDWPVVLQSIAKKGGVNQGFNSMLRRETREVRRCMVVCWQKHARVYLTACNPHQGGSVPLLRLALFLLVALQTLVKPPPSGRAHQALSTAPFATPIQQIEAP